MKTPAESLCALTQGTLPGTLLVVDDEEIVRSFLADAARDIGLEVHAAATTEQCLELLKGTAVDFVLTDLRVPNLGGMELIRIIHREYPHIKTTVLTAYGTIDNAVDAIRLGASGYLVKPINLGHLQDALQKMIHEQQDDQELQLLFSQPATLGFEGMIGRSRGMREIFRIIKRVCDRNHPVLISGETGTGKELVARAIHLSGSRRPKPFVPVDCAALTPTLIGSELFGHTRGAFTGAERDSTGLLRTAKDGTIFLDEVGEIPLELQGQLLRTLQEREVRPVGSTERFKFEARVISATNRDLMKEITAGRFRQDLYFRLNVIEVTLPPLRTRREDIPLLVRNFLEKNRDLRQEVGLSKEALDRLVDYDWPGNVRELENTIERSLALSTDSFLRVMDLPPCPPLAPGSKAGPTGQDFSLKRIEREAVSLALEKSHGDKVEAARLLGVGKTTIYRWLKEKRDFGQRRFERD